MRRFAFAFALATVAVPAHAYMGPLMGLSALSTALAIAGSFAIGLLGVIWYPIKKLYRILRARGDDDIEHAERRGE